MWFYLITHAIICENNTINICRISGFTYMRYYKINNKSLASNEKFPFNSITLALIDCVTSQRICWYQILLMLNLSSRSYWENHWKFNYYSTVRFDTKFKFNPSTIAGNGFDDYWNTKNVYIKLTKSALFGCTILNV